MPAARLQHDAEGRGVGSRRIPRRILCGRDTEMDDVKR